MLIGLTLFCIAMMALSSYSDRVGGPFKAIADVTVIPLQKGINFVGSWLGDLSDNFETLRQVKEENEILRDKLETLMTENSYLQEDRHELERLQDLYQLDQYYADYPKTAAHVISKDSGNWFSTFTIDKGSADGLAKDMNVLADGGLAGIITDVGPTWAKVRAIIDDTSNVSGMALTTSDRCIVRGDLSLIGDGQIRFEQMENNDNEVKVGDQIVTSYISDRFLQGILIGYISEVTVDSNNLTRSGYITPAVNFRDIQEVLVITSTKAELTGKDRKD